MSHVAIRVKIGLKVNGQAEYPEFNKMDGALRDNMDWSHFVDKHGGWHYDQMSGHQEGDLVEQSPVGMQWGMLVVPVAFADKAASLFPDQVAILSESQAKKFYEDRAHIRDPEVHENLDVLQAVAAKRALGIDEDQQDRDALSPDHPSVGRRRNKLKTWDNFKTNRGITTRP